MRIPLFDWQVPAPPALGLTLNEISRCPRILWGAGCMPPIDHPL